MRKIPTLFIAILSCGVGFFIGVRTFEHFSLATEREMRLTSIEERCDLSLRSLKLLRSNPTNTIEFLENELDLTVVELGNILIDRPNAKWAQSDIKLLRKVKEYRSNFPRTAKNSERQKRIQEIFDKL